MVNEYAFCPRLFHLMFVDGRWDDNLYTDQGRSAHARLDARDDPLPPPPADAEEPPVIARSVNLGSDALGLSAKLDLLELDGEGAVPVDTKRGSPPKNTERCYEPERVQLMAQGMLLREHGLASQYGMLYFAEARKRVRVDFTPELEARTRHLVNEAREASRNPAPPPPLEDSPKCFGCSLAGICLPDETRLLGTDPADGTPPPDIRRLYPARDDALPLYIQEQGARVGKSGESLQVSQGTATLGSFPLKDVSQLVLCGNVAVSAQCLHLLCERGIPVVHLSMGHWFYGITCGHGLKNAYDRAAQFAVASDDGRRLRFAREFVRAKAQNQRTLLRRNSSEPVDGALADMKRLIATLDRCDELDSLLGIEGSLAAVYFQHFATMLQPGPVRDAFAPASRNRRPPRDPLNAMLSFGYAMLAKDATVALMAQGLDPWWGLYHRPRHGRPALALDLMEEFRPLIVDSAVITALNTGRLTPDDFVVSTAGCAMKDKARKTLINAYEQRLDLLLTHPVFGYRCSWRAVIRVQAKLLSKALRGEIAGYTGITTR
jgi:CRISPR-associated endonuclease Cas1/CRISPR-associated protein Cas4